MAAPTATRTGGAVQEFPPSGPLKTVISDVVFDGNTGASANDVPASLFGLTKITRVHGPIVKSDNTLVVSVGVQRDGKGLIGKNAGSNAAANIPAGTYSVEVRGY